MPILRNVLSCDRSAMILSRYSATSDTARTVIMNIRRYSIWDSAQGVKARPIDPAADKRLCDLHGDWPGIEKETIL